MPVGEVAGAVLGCRGFHRQEVVAGHRSVEALAEVWFRDLLAVAPRQVGSTVRVVPSLLLGTRTWTGWVVPSLVVVAERRLADRRGGTRRAFQAAVGLLRVELVEELPSARLGVDSLGAESLVLEGPKEQPVPVAVRGAALP